jgi:hypothetical protein
MKGDFSQWMFNPTDNFAGVLHQQGRVLLDKDWNDQTQINRYWQETTAQDVIGGGMAAVPATAPDAFKVTHAQVVGTDVNLTLLPGRIWADGLLVHLDGTAPVNRTATYLQPPIQDPPGTVATIAAGVRDAVILEVWPEALNGFQLPNTLIEPALGGPDTTERVHTAMALRLFRLDADETCDTIRDRLADDFASKGKLTVSLQPTTVIGGDCPVVAGGGYTGFEHHLYRIEIAQVDAATPMFKWSQFNGGLVGRGLFDAVNRQVQITANLPAITSSGLSEFYLEAVQYQTNVGFWRVTYGATVTLNNDNELELPVTPTYGSIPTPSDPANPAIFFRLWNGIRPITDFPVVVAPTEPNPLADGIRLAFDAAATGNYTPGDYWTFTVRAGEISNPEILINHQPPAGIHYHRVPLAELTWDADQNISFEALQIEDCRQVFRPLTRQKICCTLLVGDGLTSKGDFNSLEEALRHLPASGGKICLLPGQHQANAEIRNRRNIQISGCGVHTIVTPHTDPNRINQPIFTIDASENIQLDQMTLMHLTGTAIQVLDGANANQGSREIGIRHNRIQATVHAIEVRVKNQLAGNNDIVIAENLIAMLDVNEGKAAIFSIADHVVIERNRLVVVPAPRPERPEGDPRGPDTPGEVFDPCRERKPYYTNRRLKFQLLQATFLYAASLAVARKFGYLAQGGIQIGGGSERVNILANQILGGRGHGVTLGDIPETVVESAVLKKNYGLLAELPGEAIERLRGSFISYVYEVTIAENIIRDMGLCGVGVVAFFNLATINLLVTVNDLTIYRNSISDCAQQLPPEIPESLLATSGFGGIALASCENTFIQENRIENNGVDHLHPLCGIFILNSETLDISTNRILNNGPRISSRDENLRRGWRGGIVIGLSFKALTPQTFADNQWLSQDGIPAVKIHNNIVTQPVGQSLFLIALGPVSVVGNSFTTQATDFRVNIFALLAGTVFILNLGFSRDLVGFLFLNSFKQAGQNKLVASNPSPIRLLYLPSGTVMFANNQVSLDVRSPDVTLAFSSQLIASLDDVAYTSNQTDCNSLLDFLFTDVALYGFTVRSNDNRLQEGITLILYSIFSYATMNTAASNQSTHCLIVLGNPAFTVLSPDNRVLFNPNNCQEQLQVWRRFLRISD